MSQVFFPSSFLSSGPLRYSMSPEGYKLIVEVDPEITRFARALIPKHLYPQPTRYAAHITVVRKETPVRIEAWGAFEGREVTFAYSPTVDHDDVHFWLCCWSPFLLSVREGLGLPSMTELTRPPNGEDCFHSTVATARRR